MSRPLSVLCALSLSACAEPATAPSTAEGFAAPDVRAAVVAAATLNRPGSTDTVTLAIDGFDREFIVHVGRSARPRQAAPVVFMLHGTSGNGRQFFNHSGWREVTNAEGAISVFPSALRYCFRDDSNRDGVIDAKDAVLTPTKWTSGALGTPAQPLCDPVDYTRLSPAVRREVLHRFSDDIQFIDAIVAHLKANYLIDAKRLYLAGFSNGGEMVGRLAVERSQVFAAGASHSGYLRVTPNPLSGRPMPFIRSVGNADPNFFFMLPGTRAPIAEATVRIPFVHADFVAPHLAQQQLKDIAQYSETKWNNRTVGLWSYTQPIAAPTTFLFAMIAGNVHEYPNGTNHPVKLAERIWPYFVANPMP